MVISRSAMDNGRIPSATVGLVQLQGICCLAQARSNAPFNVRPLRRGNFLCEHYILLKAGEYLKASYLAETLSMSEPDDVDRLLMVARYRYKAGEYADALAWLMSVQKKCSEDAYFHYLCAQCHAALGDEDTAKDSLKKVSAMSEDLKMRAVHDPVFDFIFG